MRRVDRVQNATIPNMVTINAGGGNSRIEYSAAFLDKVRELFGDDARIGMLAHEFGHHVDQNSVRAAWIDGSWNGELRADSWAGCALAKLGLKTQGIKDALRAIAATESSATQGSNADAGWDQRWVAVQTGYDACAPGGGKLASLASAAQVTGMGGGCANNTDCRMGRLCVNARCENQSFVRGTCTKDVDCPEGELCTAAGRCECRRLWPARRGRPYGIRADAISACLPQECGVERSNARVREMNTLNECPSDHLGPRLKECLVRPGGAQQKTACLHVCETLDRADKCEAATSPTESW